MKFIEDLKFDDKGLIPAVCYDYDTNRVLMVAYMNKDTVKQTLETKKCTYYSRSRDCVWVKGETSGHFQELVDMYVDCDCDTLLLKVKQMGAACHTGNKSCFYRKVNEAGELEEISLSHVADCGILDDLYKVVEDRAENPKEGSYTNYLLEHGIDKILKKVGEECSEVIIGAKNADKDEISYEVADLMYHLTVMLQERGLSWKEIYEELAERYK